MPLGVADQPSGQTLKSVWIPFSFQVQRVDPTFGGDSFHVRGICSWSWVFHALSRHTQVWRFEVQFPQVQVGKGNAVQIEKVVVGQVGPCPLPSGNCRTFALSADDWQCSAAGHFNNDARFKLSNGNKTCFAIAIISISISFSCNNYLSCISICSLSCLHSFILFVLNVPLL